MCLTLYAIVSLYIGKNHQLETSPIQSIFRLAGNDEDALTFALGYLLAYDPTFCAKIIRLFVHDRRKRSNPDYSIFLQEVTGLGFGRRDIVIQGSEERIVVEAKIGGSEPTAEQLLKYGAEQDLWSHYKFRTVVSLTRGELSTATREKVRSKLSEKGIQFLTVQWHQVIDLVLRHRHSDDSPVSRYLFDEFANYVLRDYKMGYYDAEVSIQDVNPENAKIYEKGWVYVTSLKDKTSPLYFAPYFTQQRDHSGISKVSRVLDVQVIKPASLSVALVAAPSQNHRRRWEDGIRMILCRHDINNFIDSEVRLLCLDCPVHLGKTLTKANFKPQPGSKKIPNQIPKGFSLRFDELLMG